MSGRQVWITGAHLVSSIADGAAAHWERLQEPLTPNAVPFGKTGYPIHPLPALNYSSQVPSAMDLKRMGPLQSSGAYAAGCAFDAAGLKADKDALARTIVIVSGAGGERDTALDESIFADLKTFSDPATLNETLSTRTRPSLFLTQLPNLLAGNISILFGVKGGSRTTMGEELAGVNAFKLGHRLVRDGSTEVALVGGAFNAARYDLLLLYALGRYLWRQDYQPLAARADHGGGLILGSMSAFLVLESEEHTRKRSATPWCRVDGVSAHHTQRAAGEIDRSLSEIWNELKPAATGKLGIVSGATGCLPMTAEEFSALRRLSGNMPIAETGSLFGHGMEASFLFNAALSAMLLKNRRMPASLLAREATPSEISQVLVTSVGHYRGEAAALLAGNESASGDVT